ncbi:late-transcription coactivator [Xanthomonas phage BUDD]|nr:late-transcription coactivator [Xanthomonas phage BUDD]
MSYSEKILEELMIRSKRDNIGLFEAASDYCEEHDLEQSEFVDTLDPVIIQRLKEDAARERKIRRCIQKPSRTLF